MNNQNEQSKSVKADNISTNIKKEVFQSSMVQNLPSYLADDCILQNLLSPLSPNGKIKNLENYPNVLPLKVNINSNQDDIEIDGKKLNIGLFNRDKDIQFDSDKGFVSTNWTSFKLDPEEKDKLTDDPKGIFIRHLTTTVINPNKGAMMNGIDIKNVSFTSPKLINNSWSNVILYNPNEQIFKYDFEKKKLVRQTNLDDQRKS